MQRHQTWHQLLYRYWLWMISFSNQRTMLNSRSSIWLPMATGCLYIPFSASILPALLKQGGSTARVHFFHLRNLVQLSWNVPILLLLHCLSTVWAKLWEHLPLWNLSCSLPRPGKARKYNFVNNDQVPFATLKLIIAKYVSAWKNDEEKSRF